MIPTQITIPHSSQGAAAATIIATTSSSGTHQAKFTGSAMKLERDTKVSVVSARPLPPIVSTVASYRKLLPVFLAVLRYSVSGLTVLPEGLFAWLCSLICVLSARAPSPVSFFGAVNLFSLG